MIFKLCYLYTFITATLNVIGVIALSWQTIFMPSIIAFGVNMALLVVCFIAAVIANK